MRRTLSVFAIVGAAGMLGAGQAAATELVDNDRAQCPSAPHATIQDGVDAASPGEAVEVCAGVYREVVQIAGPAKDGVRLKAKAVHQATIKVPADRVGGVVVVSGADRVEVSRFRIVGPFTGPGGFGCPSGVATGVFVTGGSTGVKVLANEIHQMQDQSGGTCAGFQASGVQVFDARAAVGDNQILDYQNVGVFLTQPSPPRAINTFAAIYRSTFVAAAVNEEGPSQVGILVAAGTQADITNNTISKNLGQTDFARDGTGIDLGGDPTGKVRVAGNRVFENDAGVNLINQDKALLASNIVIDNGDTGISADSQSAGNRFDSNDARGNGGLDCLDASVGGPPGSPRFGTLNVWVRNRGFDAALAGICTP